MRFGESGGGETIGESIETFLCGLDVVEFRLEFLNRPIVVVPRVFVAEIMVVGLFPTELGDDVADGGGVVGTEHRVGYLGRGRWDTRGVGKGECRWEGRGRSERWGEEAGWG